MKSVIKNLVQFQEGEVTIIDDLSENDERTYKVYLSESRTEIGNLTILFNGDSSYKAFLVPPGHLIYATIYLNDTIIVQSKLIQCYQILKIGYTISSFFHSSTKNEIWAIGTNNDDPNIIGLLKSFDYFDNYETVQTFNLSDLGSTSVPYLTVYVDKFDYVYISARPYIIISKDGGLNFEPISEKAYFQNPDTALIVPSWSIAEDDNGLITIAEYGDYDTYKTPHHHVLYSVKTDRTDWEIKKFDGRYKHIHSYQINPYDNNIHYVSIGDFLESSDTMEDGYFSPGYYISIDGGKNWGTNILADLKDYYGTLFNGPCNATFFPNKRAFITNDSNGESGYWWITAIDDPQKINKSISLLDAFDYLKNAIDDSQGVGYRGYPVTPWCAISIRNKYQTYCCANSNRNYNNPPMPLFRYDDETKEITVIAASRNYDFPFRYLSTGKGNVIPENSKFIFSDGYGGIRIPIEQ